MTFKKLIIDAFDFVRGIFAFCLIGLIGACIFTALIPPLWWIMRFWFHIWGLK
jgi:hypothetical protein